MMLSVFLSLTIINFFELSYQFFDTENLILNPVILDYYVMLKERSFIFVIISMLGLRWMGLHLFNYSKGYLIKKREEKTHEF